MNLYHKNVKILIRKKFALSFLLLLPRQIISDSIGTCYEEYVQDANRHYKVAKIHFSCGLITINSYSK